MNNSSMYGEMKKNDIKKVLNKCYGANYDLEPFIKNNLKLMLMKYIVKKVK